MKIRYHRNFRKSFIKSPKVIQQKIIDTTKIFTENPFDDKLRNHVLTWKFIWFRSFDVTWDWRVIFKELSDNRYEIVELINVWTHSQLYW